jgi:hypothetical protein
VHDTAHNLASIRGHATNFRHPKYIAHYIAAFRTLTAGADKVTTGHVRKHMPVAVADELATLPAYDHMGAAPTFISPLADSTVRMLAGNTAILRNDRGLRWASPTAKALHTDYALTAIHLLAAGEAHPAGAAHSWAVFTARALCEPKTPHTQPDVLPKEDFGCPDFLATYARALNHVTRHSPDLEREAAQRLPAQAQVYVQEQLRTFHPRLSPPIQPAGHRPHAGIAR